MGWILRKLITVGHTNDFCAEIHFMGFLVHSIAGPTLDGSVDDISKSTAYGFGRID